MRTLAYVESSDTNSFTMAQENSLGIWTPNINMSTFNAATNATGPTLKNQIEQALNINYSDVSFYFNLTVPLHSVIVARSVLHLSQSDRNSLCKVIPTIDSTVCQMARFWNACFRRNTGNISTTNLGMFTEKYWELQNKSNDGKRVIALCVYIT